jgi:parvulin-like peptidyl-prolyl isomerase
MVLRNPNINFDTLPKNTQDMVMDELIKTKLLRQYAIKSGIQKDKQYIKALENIKKDIALQVWMQKFLNNLKISLSEQKSFFQKNKDKFSQPEQFKARHILVKTKKEAQELIKELKVAKQTQQKFIELAKTKSTGPSGQNGGDLGWFDAKRMVPEFSKALQKLKIGTFTLKPVKTQFGYHVIYLEGKKDAKSVTFNEVQKKIVQIIKQEKFKNEVNKIVNKLKTKAKITYSK